MDDKELNHRLEQLEQQLQKEQTSPNLLQRIVDMPFADKLLCAYLDLGIVVLLSINHTQRTIDRVALSNTDLAAGAVTVSEKPFHEIRIPLGNQDNAIARAVRTKQTQLVTDWYELFTPELSAESARRNQLAASIESSIVVPHKEGAVIFSLFQPAANIDKQHFHFVEGYTRIVSKLL
jgi:hypothetical protein